MSNKEIELNLQEALYIKKLYEDFKNYCKYWRDFTSKIIFDIETLTLIIEYKIKGLDKWRHYYNYKIASAYDKFIFWHSEVDTKPKLIDFVIELKQSKIKVEEKVKEFIKEVEIIIRDIKKGDWPIKSSVYGDKVKIITELEEILIHKENFFNDSLGVLKICDNEK